LKMHPFFPFSPQKKVILLNQTRSCNGSFYSRII
jgi:hypothetical protein